MEVYTVDKERPRRKFKNTLRSWALPLLIGALCVLLLVVAVGSQMQTAAYKHLAASEKAADKAAVKSAVKETTKKVTAKVQKEMQADVEQTRQKSEKLLETVYNLKKVITNLEQAVQQGDTVVGATGSEVAVSTPAPPAKGAEDDSFYLNGMVHEMWAWATEQIVQRARVERDAKLTASLQSYMRDRNFQQGLIDMAPLMVQLGNETGNDARLCPVTAGAESSGGRVCCGSCNPFGALGMSFSSWEAGVRYYFKRITEFGYNGDVWHIAWFWYGGGSSMDGRAESYANNVTGEVQSIQF